MSKIDNTNIELFNADCMENCLWNCSCCGTSQDCLVPITDNKDMFKDVEIGSSAEYPPPFKTDPIHDEYPKPPIDKALLLILPLVGAVIMFVIMVVYYS